MSCFRFTIALGPICAEIMDDNLQKILDALPDKPPRSRLEPYRAFIEELRSRGRTFREIAGILAEKCEIQVTGSGIHDFLRSRSRREKRQPKKTVESDIQLPTRSSADPSARVPSEDEVHRRIPELKARSSTPRSDSKVFEYDPDEPLRLKKT